MKKIVTLLLALALAPSALGQSVGASQIKKRSAGGLVADSANALTVAVYRGTAPPNAPLAGMTWCDTTTTPCTLKTYSGTEWTSSPNTVVMTQPTLATLPASPTDGQIVWVSSQARAIVYVASEAKWYYLDATGRAAQADYSINTMGYSTDFLASPGNTTGTLVAGGSMTTGDHSCAVTHYNSTGGETMVGGTYTATVPASGNKTMSLTFAATGIGVAGKRIYCSKAGQSTPLWLVASIDDNTTGTYNVTVADTSFLTNTAPDKDFSAPLPAGWVYSAPDRSWGGCGSTGTTLLCSLTKVITSTGSATSAGLRLYYEIAGDPAAWRASWRVPRIATGFPGNASDFRTFAPLVTIAASASGAPVMVTGFSFSQDSNSLAWNTTRTPIFHVAYRGATNTNWVATAGGFARGNVPPIKTTAAYVSVTGRIEGTNYAYVMESSQNGVDFTPIHRSDTLITALGNHTACSLASFCTATKLGFVGVSIEVFNNNSSLQNGMVYELDSFRWQSE